MAAIFFIIFFLPNRKMMMCYATRPEQKFLLLSGPIPDVSNGVHKNTVLQVNIISSGFHKELGLVLSRVRTSYLS